MAKLLISNGAKVKAKNRFGETPIFNAIDFDLIEIIKFFIEHKADLNIRGMYKPLRRAKERGNMEIANLIEKSAAKEAEEQLIAKVADVNVRNEDGQTPLFHAAATNSVKAAELFIVHGADVNARDFNGKTPLFSATRTNSTEVAELLITKVAEVNARDKDGQTPLHIFIFNEIAECLIARGADVNVKNKKGQTPLSRALALNSTEIVRLLILKGADANAKADDGETPLLKATWIEAELLHLKYVAQKISAILQNLIKHQEP